MPNFFRAGLKLRLAAAGLLLVSAACVPASPEDAKPVVHPSAPTSLPVQTKKQLQGDKKEEAFQAPANPSALLIPVQGIAANQLRDSFTEARGQQRSHEALDIMAPRGTPVLAADDGRIVKLFVSKPGGITLYQFDSTERLAYYYAHMDRYADGIAEGQVVRRGTVIGYVGSTGNADANAPHLHFAIFRLGAEKQWWKGEAINPFSYLGGQKP